MTAGLKIGFRVAIWLMSALLVFACSHSSSSNSECGNGVVDPGETCDTSIASSKAGACPTSCDNSNACANNTVEDLGTCTARCVYTPITECGGDIKDGCCPAGCSHESGAKYDSDCVPTCAQATDNNCCGNGKVEVNVGETCDKEIAAGETGACPTSCDDGNKCDIGTIIGSKDNCNVTCVYQTITECKGGDGCCPANCDSNTDNDCSDKCGNGILDPGETCDPKIAAGQSGACPTSCDDSKPCTYDSSTGNTTNCTLLCTHTAITQCNNFSSDGCCPDNCDLTTDIDCSDKCGNGTLDKGETCDKGIASGQSGACPESCDDSNACTDDSHTGTWDNCTFLCTNTAITQCRSVSDGCCPAGCDATTGTATSDPDCISVCGNGIIEPGEECDPPINYSCDANCQKCVDLTGTWITHIKTTGTIGLPLGVGTITNANIDVVKRIVVKKSSSDINYQFDICSLSVDGIRNPGSQPQTIVFDFSKLLSTFTTTATQPDKCVLLKETVTFPIFKINSGWDGPPSSYPECDVSWDIMGSTCTPTSSVPTCDNSGTNDADKDGNYGITIPFKLFGIQFCGFGGLTITTELNNTNLANQTTVTCNVNFSILGYSFSIVGAYTRSGQINITPDSNAIAVTFIKLPNETYGDDVPCATVLTHCVGACVP